MKKLIQLLFISLAVSSCHHYQSEESFEDADIVLDQELAPLARHESVPPLPPLKKKDAIKKKLIKDGFIRFRASDLESSKTRVDSLIKKFDAYYSKENLNNTAWKSSYNLTIRIPSSNFESFVHAIQLNNEEILNKEVDVRDVTDQFIDLGIRLENKEAYLKRYQELLRKATSVEEILQVEEKIRLLEEEIESTTGTLEYLSDLVDYSTLNLNIIQQKDFKYNPEKREKITERMKQSLAKGWFGLVDFFLFSIRIWPFWIIAAPLFYLLIKLRRKKKHTK